MDRDGQAKRGRTATAIRGGQGKARHHPSQELGANAPGARASHVPGFSLSGAWGAWVGILFRSSSYPRKSWNLKGARLPFDQFVAPAHEINEPFRARSSYTSDGQYGRLCHRVGLQMTPEDRLRLVWNQQGIPVVLRRGGKGQLPRVRLPFSNDNRSWLSNGRTRSPSWIAHEKYREIPKAWFNDFVHRALQKYGKLYVIQPYRDQEKCAPACLNAVGHECECSCMGANHGAGNDGSWFEVSDTFATRWSSQMIACRLMVSK